jgi:hypothetical protein
MQIRSSEEALVGNFRLNGMEIYAQVETETIDERRSAIKSIQPGAGEIT